MKLRHPVRHPDQLIRLRLPGEVAYLLERYRVYQTDTTQMEWDRSELITEMLRSFLEEGDREFLAWRKAQDTVPAMPTPVPPAANGSTASRKAAPE
jgi:hypothetical protein